MGDENAGPSPPFERTWKDYWSSLGQPWRTEPEISPQRQVQLTLHRQLVPDIQAGVYSFAQVTPRLTRADIEWLLATHEAKGIVGPVSYSDDMTYRRSLDLRGADLRHLDLSALPLGYTYGGLHGVEWDAATPEQREQAAIQLEGASLDYAELPFCHYAGARLERVSLRHAVLNYATLTAAHLAGSDLSYASLRVAQLRFADLTRATLVGAYMRGAELRQIRAEGVDCSTATLESVDLRSACLDVANLIGAHLEYSNLSFVSLCDADLTDASLKQTIFFRANLTHAVLTNVNVAEGDFRRATFG